MKKIKINKKYFFILLLFIVISQTIYAQDDRKKAIEYKVKGEKEFKIDKFDNAQRYFEAAIGYAEKKSNLYNEIDSLLTIVKEAPVKRNKSNELLGFANNQPDNQKKFLLIEAAYIADKNNSQAYSHLLNFYYNILETKPVIITRKGWIISAAFNPSSSKIITTRGEEGVIKEYDLTGKELNRIPVHGKAGVYSAKYSPISPHIITASADNTAKLWTLQGEHLLTIKHDDDVVAANFSPDSKTFITACADGIVRLYNIDGNIIKEFKGHTDRLTNAVFHPAGKMILTSSMDNTIKLWNLNGECILTINYGFDNYYEIATFTPDGLRIFATGENTPKLFTLTGKPVNLLFQGFAKNMFAASFSTDGNFIITAIGKSAVLWDLKGKQIFEFTGHTGNVFGVKYSPNGKYIISTSNDKTARLYKIQPDELISLIREKENYKDFFLEKSILVQFNILNQMNLYYENIDIVPQNSFKLNIIEKNITIAEGLNNKESTKLLISTELTCDTLLKTDLSEKQKEALKINYNQITWLYVKNKEYEFAISSADKCFNVDTSFYFVLSYKAIAYLLSGQKEKAFDIYDKYKNKSYNNFYITCRYFFLRHLNDIENEDIKNKNIALAKIYLYELTIDNNLSINTNDSITKAKEFYAQAEKLGNNMDFDNLKEDEIMEYIQLNENSLLLFQTDTTLERLFYAYGLLIQFKDDVKTKNSKERLAKYQEIIILQEKKIILMTQLHYSYSKLEVINTELANSHGNMSWYCLFAEEYNNALKHAKRGIEIDQKQEWIVTNLALSLLLTDKIEQAKEFYIEYKDKFYDSNDDYDYFKDVFLSDIEELENTGIKSDYFPEIKELLLSKTQNTFNNFEIDQDRFERYMKSNNHELLRDYGKYFEKKADETNSDLKKKKHLKKAESLYKKARELSDSDNIKYQLIIVYKKLFLLEDNAENYLFYMQESIKLGRLYLINYPNNEEIKEITSFYLGMYSYINILDNNFPIALDNALESTEIDSNQKIGYRFLALSYVLNNKFEKAKPIYLEWKDQIFSDDNGTFKEIFLYDINNLENNNITHPDFQKVKNLLK